jgi:hypothetical protein
MFGTGAVSRLEVRWVTRSMSACVAIALFGCVARVLV